MEHTHSSYLRLDRVRVLAVRMTFETPGGGLVTPLDDVISNEFATLLDPAGFGKTTLLKTTAGFDSGEIFSATNRRATCPLIAALSTHQRNWHHHHSGAPEWTAGVA